MRQSRSTPRSNPVAQWLKQGGIPDFAAIKPDDLEITLNALMRDEMSAARQVAGSKDKPTFTNATLALETAAASRDQLSRLFNLLGYVDPRPAMQDVVARSGPKLATHQARLNGLPNLYDKLKTVTAHQRTPIKKRLTDKYLDRLKATGAHLGHRQKGRLTELLSGQSTLYSTFSSKLAIDNEKPALILTDVADLAGLPDTLKDSAAALATSKGLTGQYVFMPSDSDAFLTWSDRRDLREAMFRASMSRGNSNDKADTKQTITAILANSREQATFLGYATPADMYMRDNLISDPAKAEDMLRESWRTSLAAYTRDQAILQDAAAHEGVNAPLEAWDWRYYQRKVKAERYQVDEAEVSQYLSLDTVLNAAFTTANKLWGINFSEVTPSGLYHEDARLWQVNDKDGSPLGNFIGDFYVREGKQQVTWMDELRRHDQTSGTTQTPIAYSLFNFARPSEGQPTLLSLGEAKAIFHEFGHSLHSLLSTVPYPTLSGCNGPMDYLEMPSQMFEKFVTTPEIAGELKHHTTGRPMPLELIDKVRQADNFCYGHVMLEFLASCVTDLRFYSHTDDIPENLGAFEQAILAEWQMPQGVAPSYPLTAFSHIFGGGYPGGYLSYETACKLDADAFDTLCQAGGGSPFNPQAAARLRNEVFATGASRPPLQSFTAFTGHEPKIEPLLKFRGFTP